ncbi:MAG: hypothetical protein DWI48_05630 [Chloroflexi bacterium]|nr:MAG: hypothetical protein DWI48_05630 [Chloroflexota bacterium]
MTSDTWTCVVCGEQDTGVARYEFCNGCGGTYHFNQTMHTGKDCGAAWMEDEEEGMMYFCNGCMDSARAEDQQRVEDFSKAAASGQLTPDMLVEMMQTMQKMGTQAAAAGLAAMAPQMPQAGGMPTGFGLPDAYANFPDLTGLGAPTTGNANPFSGPVSAADLSRMFGAAMPAPTNDESEDAPEASSPPARSESNSSAPPLLPRRPRTERRFRRVQ